MTAVTFAPAPKANGRVRKVGGVTVDLVGNAYVADFGDFVWKIGPAGDRREFASGLNAALGNASDKEGNPLQSNFYGDSITRWTERDKRNHSRPPAPGRDRD